LEALAMTDKITVAKVRSVETVSKPTAHVLVKLETATGALVLKVSIADAHKLRECLKGLPTNIEYQSPVTKLP
jgi:hypothetical protein